jgi:hypothetical protein
LAERGATVAATSRNHQNPTTPGQAHHRQPIFNVIYGWGLRRTETARLDVADFGRNPRAPQR